MHKIGSTTSNQGTNKYLRAIVSSLFDGMPTKRETYR